MLTEYQWSKFKEIRVGTRKPLSVSFVVNLFCVIINCITLSINFKEQVKVIIFKN